MLKLAQLDLREFKPVFGLTGRVRQPSRLAQGLIFAHPSSTYHHPPSWWEGNESHSEEGGGEVRTTQISPLFCCQAHLNKLINWQIKPREHFPQNSLHLAVLPNRLSPHSMIFGAIRLTSRPPPRSKLCRNSTTYNSIPSCLPKCRFH